MSLYSGWRETLQANRSNEAIREVATGKKWTFGEVQTEVDRVPAKADGGIRVVGVEEGILSFVVKTLAAWRDGAVLMPVEDLATDCAWSSDELPDGTVHLKTTSGSTGRPQTIAFTAEQLEADLEAIEKTMGLRFDEPNLGVVSAAHSYGFSNLILPLLLRGMPIWQVRDPLPGSVRAAWRMARDEGRTLTVPAVPAMWRAWLLAGMLPDAPVGLAISAGAPMPLPVEREIFETAGLKVHTFYGASECGGIAFDDSDAPRTDGQCVGRPMRGVSVSVSDDGCLAVHSAAVAIGYIGSPTEIDQRVGGGCFRTTDCAIVQGRQLLLTGRLTDCINVAGRKISPHQIESAILRQDAVAHCLVFGVPSLDSARVEDIVACVNVESPTDMELLKSQLGRELPSWQQPRIWWCATSLRPDARGKLSRAQWRERYLAENRLPHLVSAT